jgi:hypothetical protein
VIRSPNPGGIRINAVSARSNIMVELTKGARAKMESVAYRSIFSA